MGQTNRWDAFSDDELETLNLACTVAMYEEQIETNDPLWCDIKSELARRKGA